MNGEWQKHTDDNSIILPILEEKVSQNEVVVEISEKLEEFTIGCNVRLQMVEEKLVEINDSLKKLSVIEMMEDNTDSSDAQYIELDKGVEEMLTALNKNNQ